MICKKKKKKENGMEENRWNSIILSFLLGARAEVRKGVPETPRGASGLRLQAQPD
jgi:hypothetical protein